MPLNQCLAPTMLRATGPWSADLWHTDPTFNSVYWDTEAAFKLQRENHKGERSQTYPICPAKNWGKET